MGIFQLWTLVNRSPEFGSKTQLASLREISPGLRLAYASIRRYNSSLVLEPKLDSSLPLESCSEAPDSDVLRQGLHQTLVVSDQVACCLDGCGAPLTSWPEDESATKGSEYLSHGVRMLDFALPED